MAYEQYCAACTYMSDDLYYGKYYCSIKGDYRCACDSKCYNFCEAYGRSNYARENMYQNSQSSMSSGCYLTTIMCQILNYPDNNYYLNTLRKFRDINMQTNPNYIPLLLSYDIYGPIIAKNLSNDKHKKEIATLYFNEFITKAVSAIEENKEQQAIDIYVAMTNSLANHYNINTNIIIPTKCELDTYDIKTLGHGKTLTKVKRIEK